MAPRTDIAAHHSATNVGNDSRLTLGWSFREAAMSRFVFALACFVAFAFSSGVAVAQTQPTPPDRDDYVDRLLAERAVPPAELCGSPGEERLSVVAGPCEGQERASRVVFCVAGGDGALKLRADTCDTGETMLSRARMAAIAGLLPPRPTVSIDDFAPTPPPIEPLAAINKCGKAACLCTGTFCADLIDAGYCDDFRCASPQCICIFPE